MPRRRFSSGRLARNLGAEIQHPRVATTCEPPATHTIFLEKGMCRRASVSQEELSLAIAPKLIIGLKGENLLNDDIQNGASFKKDEVLQPGANVRLIGTLAC